MKKFDGKIDYKIFSILKPHILSSGTLGFSIPLERYYLKIDKELEDIDIRELELCFNHQYGNG